jgi:hypothetical protein
MPVTTDESARLRRFLLGQLSEPERVEVEQRLMTEESLFQELLLLEEDLTDEYVFGDLPEAERGRFEQHVAVSPDRLEAIRLARLLRRPAAAAGRRPRQGGWWRAAAALLGLAALSGALIAYHQRSARLEREAAAREQALRNQNEALARELERERARPAGSGAGSPAASPTPRPAAPTPPPAAVTPLLASIALSPGSLRSRSEVPTLRPPGPGGRVRLFLTLDDEGDGHYAADLLGDAGRLLWRSERLRSSDGLVVIADVPSDALEPGQYRVVLRQDRDGGPPDVVATYPLVVARR